MAVICSIIIFRLKVVFHQIKHLRQVNYASKAKLSNIYLFCFFALTILRVNKLLLLQCCITNPPDLKKAAF